MANMRWFFTQFGLVKELAADKSNTVIGVVRNVEAAKARFAAELPGANVHTVYGDLNNGKTLEVSPALVPSSTTTSKSLYHRQGGSGANPFLLLFPCLAGCR